MSSYIQINPDGSRQTVLYNRNHDGPVSERLTILARLRWLRRRESNSPVKGKFKAAIIQLDRRLSALDLSISRQKPRTRQPARRAGVHQPVHTTAPQQGHRDQPGSRPVSGEKTSCTAAASLGGSSPSQTGNTRHTPSTFAAPTQSPSTADAGGSVASPDNHGI